MYTGGSWVAIDVDTDYPVYYASNTNGYWPSTAEINKRLQWTTRPDPPCNEQCGCCFPDYMEASFSC